MRTLEGRILVRGEEEAAKERILVSGGPQPDDEGPETGREAFRSSKQLAFCAREAAQERDVRLEPRSPLHPREVLDGRGQRVADLALWHQPKGAANGFPP